jgi:alpha,alpha-trehalase
MLFYLFSADELAIVFERLGYPFEKGTIPKNIDYYLQRTSHGSTLSWVVHAWVLARANRPRAWVLFNQALDSDIADIQGGTTPEGIHLGAMAGSVDLVQRCFIGIETRAGVLYFNPSLPRELNGVKVQLRYRRHQLDVAIDQDSLVVSSRHAKAAPIIVAYRGHFREMVPGDSYTFRLLKAGEADRDENRRLLQPAKDATGQSNARP